MILLSVARGIVPHLRLERTGARSPRQVGTLWFLLFARVGTKDLYGFGFREIQIGACERS